MALGRLKKHYDVQPSASREANLTKLIGLRTKKGLAGALVLNLSIPRYRLFSSAPALISDGSLVLGIRRALA